MKRLMALCAPIATAAVLVLAPAAAQAESDTYWYAHKQILTEILPVEFHGVSSIYLGSYGFRTTCSTRGAGGIANAEGEGGYSEITELHFDRCRAEVGLEHLNSFKPCAPHTKPEIAAEGLPWSGFLNYEQQDVTEGVHFVLSCSGEEPEEISGSIVALVGPGRLQFGQEYFDEHSNFLEPDALFTGVWRIIGPVGYRPITALEVLD